jgi:hypothetical protein
MKHARPDYQRIQDPAVDDPSLLAPGATPIGADEPVMLFRAQDRHFCGLLADYKARLELDPAASAEIIDAVAAQIREGRAWQAVRGCKTPDL